MYTTVLKYIQTYKKPHSIYIGEQIAPAEKYPVTRSVRNDFCIVLFFIQVNLGERSLIKVCSIKINWHAE